jgi:hypothetical protein
MALQKTIALVLYQDAIDNPFVLEQLFVCTLTGKTITIREHQLVWVEDLKFAIKDMDGIPPDQQLLIFKGKELREGNRLRYYSVYAITLLLTDRLVHTYNMLF